MPQKERRQRGFLALEKPSEHERKETAQQQKDNDKHIRYGRCEIAAKLPFGDGPDIPPCTHDLTTSWFNGSAGTLRPTLAGAVSGRVMARNTSSSRPSSVCNSSIFQPSLRLTSATLRASSPLRVAP